MSITLKTKPVSAGTELHVVAYGDNEQVRFVVCPELGVGLRTVNDAFGSTLFQHPKRGEVTTKMLMTSITLEDGGNPLNKLINMPDLFTRSLEPVSKGDIEDLRLLEVASISANSDLHVYFNDTTAFKSPALSDLIDGLSDDELVAMMERIFGPRTTTAPAEQQEPTPNHTIH